MPFVQISLGAGQPAAYRRAIGDGVHRALIEALGIPPDDHFQEIHELAAMNLIYDPDYLGIKRSDEVVFIRITLAAGRTVAQKRALYARITEQLADNPGVRPQDVLIVLIETAAENWSFGNGVAQYADRAPSWVPDSRAAAQQRAASAAAVS